MQSEEARFETILSLAKNKDKKALAAIIASKGCIGVFHGEYNPIMSLAKENLCDAMDFLIGEFKASLNHAVQGAGCGSHVALTNTLIKRGASLTDALLGAAKGGHTEFSNHLIERSQTLDSAVYGAACGGYFEYTNALLNQEASLNYAVRGAAQGGHIEFTSTLIDRGASIDYAVWGASCRGLEEYTNNLIVRGASLDFAVYGAAMGYHVELTNKLIGLGASLNYAVWGATFGGHSAFTDILIERGASLSNAIHGAAFGGHEDLTNELLNRKANLKNAVNGAASGGHVSLTNHLIERGANLNHAVNGAAGGGHVELVNDLIARGASLTYAVRGAASCDYNIRTQKNALRFLSFIDNSNLRELIADMLKKKTDSLDTKVLLEKTSLLNQLMRKKKLTFSQAEEYLQVESFLAKRRSRITEIEIATELYQKIGEKFANSNKLKLKHEVSNTDYGYIYQYFGFMQGPLLDKIYTQFVAIAGNYDTKKKVLKAWDTLNIPDKNKKIILLAQLKEIRDRYEKVRNNHICHINDNFDVNDPMLPQIPIQQILHDTETLRHIFNEYYVANGIPPIYKGYSHPEYPVSGLQKIFNLIFAE